MDRRHACCLLTLALISVVANTATSACVNGQPQGGTGPCETCDGGFWGSDCSSRCSCNPSGGLCRSGPDGDGMCSVCFANFFGPTCQRCMCKFGQCDNRTVADAGHCRVCFRDTYDGIDCDRCKPSFFGPLCAGRCTCVNGTCSDGLLGSGRCTCHHGFTGPRCDQLIVSRTHTITAMLPLGDRTTAPSPSASSQPSGPLPNATDVQTPPSDTPAAKVYGVFLIFNEGPAVDSAEKLQNLLAAWLQVAPGDVHMWMPSVSTLPHSVTVVCILDGDFTTEASRQSKYANLQRLIGSRAMATAGVLQVRMLLSDADAAEPTRAPLRTPSPLTLPPLSPDAESAAKTKSKLSSPAVAGIALAAIVTFALLLFAAWRLYVFVLIWRYQRRKANTLKFVKRKRSGHRKLREGGSGGSAGDASDGSGDAEVEDGSAPHGRYAVNYSDSDAEDIGDPQRARDLEELRAIIDGSRLAPPPEPPSKHRHESLEAADENGDDERETEQPTQARATSVRFQDGNEVHTEKPARSAKVVRRRTATSAQYGHPANATINARALGDVPKQPSPQQQHQQVSSVLPPLPAPQQPAPQQQNEDEDEGAAAVELNDFAKFDINFDGES